MHTEYMLLLQKHYKNVNLNFCNVNVNVNIGPCLCFNQ